MGLGPLEKLYRSCVGIPLLRLAVVLFFLHSMPSEANASPGDRTLAEGQAFAERYVYRDALEAFKRAEQLYAEEGRDDARAEAQIAQAAMAGVLGDAEQAFTICLKILRQAPMDAPTVPKYRAAIFMATTFIEVGDGVGARRMLDLAQPMVGKIDYAPAAASYHQARSSLAFNEQRYTDAIASARRALDSLDGVSGAGRPAFPMIWLGRSLTATGKAEQGLDWLDRAVMRAREGEHDAAEVFAQHGRAEALVQLGRMPEARRASEMMLRAAERFKQRSGGVDFFDSAAKTADMLVLHARLHEENGSPEKSAERYARAYSMMETQYARLRDDSVGIYRAGLDAALLEAEVRATRERQDVAMKLAAAQRRNAILSAVAAALAVIAAIIVFILYRKTAHQREQLRKGFVERGTLIDEIQHRSKNNLQLIVSLMNIENRSNDNVGANPMVHRIQAMASLSDRLHEIKDSRLLTAAPVITSIVEDIDKSFGVVGIDKRIECDDLLLDVEVAVPLALMVCEMCFNAYKHGLSQGGGALHVKLLGDSQGATLTVCNWFDAEVQCNSARSGIGFSLIEEMAIQAGSYASQQSQPGLFCWTVEGIRCVSSDDS